MNLDIIIKVLCGVACAIIAKNKGYSMILGFIMGYLNKEEKEISETYSYIYKK